MGQYTTTGQFLAALLAGMKARANIISEDVTVDLVAPSPDELQDGKWLYLVRGPITVTDRLAMASKRRPRDETVNIPGACQGYATGKRGDAVQNAFDNAEAILDELIAQVRDSMPEVGDQTRSALVEQIKWTPMPNEKGGWAVRGEYVLTYTSRVS